jgi:uncharacterized protein with PQ loop repeat
MEPTKLISWIGFSAGLLIGIPQIVKTMKLKSARGVSALTFLLIVITAACFLIRSFAIKELSFIAYYLFIFASASTQLFLIWKYRGR